MRCAALLLLATLTVFSPAVAQEDSPSPHRMLKPDGAVDAEKCTICHNPDMSLARPKAEVCTFCHAITIHSGAAEHLQASSMSLSVMLGGKQQSEPTLPLTENHGVFCGTCHLFHDPRVLTGEQPQTRAWVPPDTGLAATVRQAVESQWGRVAQKYGESAPGAKFSTQGTRMLRLPVSDGALCRHCHGNLP